MGAGFAHLGHFAPSMNRVPASAPREQAIGPARSVHSPERGEPHDPRGLLPSKPGRLAFSLIKQPTDSALTARAVSLPEGDSSF